MFILHHKNEFPVVIQCRAFKVKPSGYYAWIKRPPSLRDRENGRLLLELKAIYEKSRRVYGSPRIHHELRKQGFHVSRPRIARLMRKNGIHSITKRKFKVTTNSRHNKPISPNLLNRNFSVSAPNRIWTSDITYLRTAEGWLYLTIIQDLFNREIVGWSMSNRLTAVSTTIPALIQACIRHRPAPGLVFHSDQGIQYACDAFRNQLSMNRMIQSMSGKGSCYDNAVAESFFHILKTELTYHLKYETRKQARQSVFEYIEVFYNRERIQAALGYLSPAEYKNLRPAA